MIEENVLLGEQQLVSLAQVLCTVVKETNVCVQALLSTLSQMQPPITYSRWIDLQKKQKKKNEKTNVCRPPNFPAQSEAKGLRRMAVGGTLATGCLH